MSRHPPDRRTVALPSGRGTFRASAQQFEHGVDDQPQKRYPAQGKTTKKDESKVARDRLQRDKEELEAAVKNLEELTRSQMERENDDKRKLEETQKNVDSARAQLGAAKEHIRQIQVEGDRRTQQYKKELEKLQFELQRVENHLGEEKKHVEKLQFELQRVQGSYENEKERRRHLAVRCLALLRSSKEGEGMFHGRLGVSFENSQQEKKYQGMALRIIDELEPNATTIIGAQPDGKQFDIILHLARTEGGRTVNLEPSIRRQFACDNVILILLRSGNNPDVYSTFVPHDASEYSGILFGKRGERRIILQLLHWQNEWVNCKLNDDNVKLLRELVSHACPKMLETLREDQLLKALGIEEQLQ